LEERLAEHRARGVVFKARADALGLVAEREEYWQAVSKLVFAAAFLVALVVLWCFPTVRHGILLGIALFLFRYAENLFIAFRLVRPEMARIEREYPMPPRQERS
jgi:hypothetical protein